MLGVVVVAVPFALQGDASCGLQRRHGTDTFKVSRRRLAPVDYSSKCNTGLFCLPSPKGHLY